jgi:aryl-alcohol dehydrogenase-like predicted oxidoreductase
MNVSLLGFGGSEIGAAGSSIAAVERILGGALDAGLNLIDTAACYADSEELIGRAVSHRRHAFFLMTKCGHGYASGLPYDWTPALIEKSIERSLKRLRTDYLDVLQLHSCELETLARDDIIDVIVRARERGHTRFLGYSGDGPAALSAVRSGIFDTLQISVNIADQEAIELVLPAARDADVGVIAKRPIANVAWRERWPMMDGYVRPYWRRLRKLRYPFIRRADNDAIATALRFTLSTSGVHTAIVGTSNPARWAQNAALAGRGPLPSDEYEAIRNRWRAIARADWVGQR